MCAECAHGMDNTDFGMRSAWNGFFFAWQLCMVQFGLSSIGGAMEALEYSVVDREPFEPEDETEAEATVFQILLSETCAVFHGYNVQF